MNNTPRFCRGYLFCLYELLEKNSNQIAKECGVYGSIILKQLRKFNIRIRTYSEVKTGKKNPMYDRTGWRSPLYYSAWKEDDIGLEAIHYRAHKIDPKPKDGKCAICNQVADKKGITKLVHSNKDHSYRLPINPDEWWWIHDSCHKSYDANKRKVKSKKLKKSKENKYLSQVGYWLK